MYTVFHRIKEGNVIVSWTFIVDLGSAQLGPRRAIVA